MAEHEPLDGLFANARADLPTANTLRLLRGRLALPPTPARPGGVERHGTSTGITLGFCVLAVVVAYGASSFEPPPAARAPVRTRPTRATPVAPTSVVHGTYDPPEGRLPPLPYRAVEPAPPSAVEHAHGAPSEVELIEQAQSALASGELAAARHALARHRATYPTGMLTEERRSLEIELDEASGDTAAAATGLEAFRRDYPASAHLPRLERLLEVRN